MAKSLAEWVETDVRKLRDKPLSWLSEYHFFRDPCRPTYADSSYLFSPADGVILYQGTVEPDERVLDIKGKAYSLRDAMRDPTYDRPSLVIGIFLTFFDVHVIRMPFAGRLTYRRLGTIDTFNHPMLDVERSILDELQPDLRSADYLHHNERMLSRVDSIDLGQSYYILQIADYDVDCIIPFHLGQNLPYAQGERFSQIRYGSQVELVIPQTGRHRYRPVHPVGYHVEAGVDTLVAIDR